MSLKERLSTFQTSNISVSIFYESNEETILFETIEHIPVDPSNDHDYGVYVLAAQAIF